MKKNTKLDVKSSAVKYSRTKVNKRGKSNKSNIQKRELEKGIKQSINRSVKENEAKVAEYVEQANGIKDEKLEARTLNVDAQASRTSEQSESDRDSKRSLTSHPVNEKFKVFHEQCEKSKNLKGNRRSFESDSIVSLTLPSGLPAKLLLRALGEESSQYEVLTEQHLAVTPQQNQSIDVFLDHLQLDKIVQLVKELDALVGTFTARS